MERDKTSPGPLSSPHAAVHPIADPLARTDVPTSAPPSPEPMSQNAGSGSSTNPEHAAIGTSTDERTAFAEAGLREVGHT